MSIGLFLTRAASFTSSGLLRINARSNIVSHFLSYSHISHNNKKSVIVHSIKDDNAEVHASRGATLLCLVPSPSYEREKETLIVPANGGYRRRLTRWLPGGFLSCWLLRCTGPQLSAAQQKILVLFTACLCCLFLLLPA